MNAGYRRGRDFDIVTGNLQHLATMTSEIASAVAAIKNRAFYLFNGRLGRGNWNAFHVDSVLYDEPEMVALTGQTELILTFHGAERDRSHQIYVGGLHEQGRKAMSAELNAALRQFHIEAVDASQSAATQAIAGLHPRNLTNRGRMGRGILLEFSEGARLVFFPGKSRVEGQRPNENLALLAATVDAALERVINQTLDSGQTKE